MNAIFLNERVKLLPWPFKSAAGRTGNRLHVAVFFVARPEHHQAAVRCSMQLTVIRDVNNRITGGREVIPRFFGLAVSSNQSRSGRILKQHDWFQGCRRQIFRQLHRFDRAVQRLNPLVAVDSLTEVQRAIQIPPSLCSLRIDSGSRRTCALPVPRCGCA